MPKAIRFHKTGGPEVLVWEDVEVGDPGPGQIRIRHHAVGLNFVDVYQRSGLYPMPLPSGTGSEGAGVVEAVGAGVTDLKVGRSRGVCVGRRSARIREVRLYPADRAVKIPDGISFETAAAMMLKGMTAQYLIKRTFKVQPGQTVLLHAAAGGVGLIACQWLKALGVTVIGTVGSDEKAALAKAHGCEHTIVYTRENFVERVQGDHRRRGRAGGLRLGRQGHLHGIARLPAADGLMVSFGNASGPVDADRARHARAEGIALPHPADAGNLHGEARRPRGVRERSVRRRQVGQGEDRDRPALRAQGRGAGAPRPRGAQDHGLDRSHSVSGAHDASRLDGRGAGVTGAAHARNAIGFPCGAPGFIVGAGPLGGCRPS